MAVVKGVRRRPLFQQVESSLSSQYEARLKLVGKLDLRRYARTCGAAGKGQGCNCEKEVDAWRRRDRTGTGRAQVALEYY